MIRGTVRRLALVGVAFVMVAALPGCGGSDDAEIEATGTIAFVREEGVLGRANLYVMNADGTAQRRLVSASSFPRLSLPRR